MSTQQRDRARKPAAGNDAREAPSTFAHVLDALDRSERRAHVYIGRKSDETLSFAALSEQSREIGRQLLSSGLEPGDRLALVLPDAQDFVAHFLGALRVGIVAVPLYPPLALGRLKAYLETTEALLRASSARKIITSPDVEKLLWPLVEKVDSLDDILVASRLPEAACEATPLDNIAPTDLAFLQYTSGSTSRPKGVRVTHASLLANCRAAMEFALDPDRDDVLISWLPMYHDMGLIGFVCAPLVTETTTIFMPTMSFLRRPRAWLEAITKYRATISFSPNFGYAVTTRKTDDLTGLDLTSLRVLGCGAEPISGDTMRAFADKFAPVGLNAKALMPAYGMAEATLAITFSDLDEPVRVDRIERGFYQRERRAVPSETPNALEFVSCGKPLPGHSVVIRNEAGDDLGERGVGEIFVLGPSIADGYEGDLDASSRAFTRWGLRTGDLGYLAGGELYVTGRKKDLIIIGGRNIDPQTIERDAATVPGVRPGAVVAFSHGVDITEHLVIALETNQADRAALRESVATHVQRLTGLEVSDVVVLPAGALPKTSSGKLQRAKTREQFLDGSLGSEGSRTMGQGAPKLPLLFHVVRAMAIKAKLRQRARWGRALHVLNAVVELAAGVSL